MEKTEDATPRRLEKAREEGDVPRSRDLTTAAVLMAAGLGFMLSAGHIKTSMEQSMRNGLTFPREYAHDPNLVLTGIGDVVLPAILAFAPIAVVLILITLAAPAAIGGFLISGKAITPKFSKLNPIKGVANIFSKNSLVELVKAVLKASLVGLFGYLVLSSDFETLMQLASLPSDVSMGRAMEMLLVDFLIVSSALILIVGIDVPYQLYQYAEKLKMTKQEVREESKETEGSPELKAKIRQTQREMSRNRMMADVPTADIIITNPTHYAVALSYKDGANTAPIVVAKGADEVAFKIRELGKEHNVPLLESPKLARALYANSEIGDEIPQSLFAAIAEVMAYVFQLRAYKAGNSNYPDTPVNLPVPAGMDPHEKKEQI